MIKPSKQIELCYTIIKFEPNPTLKLMFFSALYKIRQNIYLS